MKKSIAFILVLCICPLFLVSCLDNDGYEAFHEYRDAANWNCDKETFVIKYHKLYLDKMESLKSKYELDCSLSAKSLYEDGHVIAIYLQNKKCTFAFYISNKENYGHYSAKLFYYGDENGFGEYEDFKPLVELLNDFTNYVAYDARDDQNHFERLYYEAMADTEKRYSNYTLHEDAVIDTVLYNVGVDYELNHKISEDGHILGEETPINIKCYVFTFCGLLKPISD